MVIKKKSVIKRIKTSERNRRRNKAHKSKIKTIIKKYTAAVKENRKEDILSSLANAYSAIDKAISKGIIPKNNGARKKSWLTKQQK